MDPKEQNQTIKNSRKHIILINKHKEQIGDHLTLKYNDLHATPRIPGSSKSVIL